MKAAIDTSFLTLLLNPKAASSVPHGNELVDELVQQLSGRNIKVIIPTPVLTEVLLKAGKSAPLYFDKLKSYSCFEVRAFDEKAAIELAQVVISSIGVKRGRKEVSQMKVTFDRQIVAVAKAHGASEMYSDDDDVRTFAVEFGLKPYSLADIKRTPRQEKLNLNYGLKGSTVKALPGLPAIKEGIVGTSPEAQVIGAEPAAIEVEINPQDDTKD